MTAQAIQVARLQAIPGLVPAAIFAVACAVRILPVGAAEFPLNDGGLFYQMSLDIKQNGYRLPSRTSYNGGEIPFAYPPLSFYIAAALSEIPGFALIDVYRLLPPVVSACVPVLVYFLLRTLLHSRILAVVAGLVYAVMPGAYEWQIAGGGMSRSFGAALMVATLWQAARMYRASAWRPVIWTMCSASLTLLTHIGFAFSLAVSAVLMFLYLGRTVGGLLRSAAVAAGGVLVTSPWWFSVVAEHGWAPFEHASRSSPPSGAGWWTSVLFAAVGEEPFLSFGAVLGVVGLFVALDRGWWILLAWAGIIPFVDPRQGPQVALIPLSAGAALALERLWLRGIATRAGGRRSVAGPLLAVYLTFALTVGAVAWPHSSSTADAVPASERRLMEWVRTYSDADADFLVMTGEDFSTSALVEWFPAITERRSVATMQGREWLSDFADRFRAAQDFRACYSSNLDCVEESAAQHGLDFDHLYLVGAHTESSGMTYRPHLLLDELSSRADYSLVRQVGGSSVWVRMK